MNIPVSDRKIASNGLLGMIFLLATEVMFFAGLISAYIVNRAGSSDWPPIGQPRLPVEITAINTLVLIASAILLFISGKKINKNSNALFFSYWAAFILGTTFVCVQGLEWYRLLHFGLSTSSSIYGAFFYVIIGAHALHVLAGLSILIYLGKTLKVEPNPDFRKDRFRICSLYWYFVSGIWPFLYYLVYLS